MGGVYGEFLGFFSELFEQFKIYKYETDRQSGYKLDYEKTITGILQSVSNRVDTNRYKQLPTFDNINRYCLWTSIKLDIYSEFVEIEGRMYRLMNEAKFNKEGGFWENYIENIVGNDGTMTVTPGVIQGSFQ